MLTIGGHDAAKAEASGLRRQSCQQERSEKHLGCAMMQMQMMTMSDDYVFMMTVMMTISEILWSRVPEGPGPGCLPF